MGSAVGASFGTLEVREVILHIVPKSIRSKRDQEPIQLSDAVCILQEEVRTQLETRLRLLLKESGRQIIEDVSTSSKLPELVRRYLDGTETNFVFVSREVATMLYEVQSGSMSGGILLVANCSFNSTSAILVVKIEREGGMRAELTDSEAGKTFDMRYFSDLFFTSKSRVYKIGLFSCGEQRSDGLLQGWAADKQLAGKTVAAFFLGRFLGCRHRDDPEELTKRFFEHGQQWVNKSVEDPTKKARYIMAITSELLNQHPTLSVTNFARNHLDEQDRDDFVRYIDNNGIPFETFDKSIELVQPQLERIQMAFASGITLIAPRSALENETITVEGIEGSHQSRVTITDEVVEMKGRGTPGRSATKHS